MLGYYTVSVVLLNFHHLQYFAVRLSGWGFPLQWVYLLELVKALFSGTQRLQTVQKCNLSTFTSFFETFFNMDVICCLGVGFSNFSMSRINSLAPTSNWFPCFARTCAFKPVVLIFPSLPTQIIAAPHFLQSVARSFPWGMLTNFQQGVAH